MADGLGLLEDGLVILQVLVGIVNGEGVAGAVHLAPEIMSPLVEEELRQVEVGPLSRDPVELGKADLDLLVAGKPVLLSGTERPDQEVGVLDGDIEEGFLPRRQKMGNRGLVHMAGAVELVTLAEVRPALLAGARGRVLRIDGPRRIEISVRLLGRGDDLDEVVELFPEAGIGMEPERIGRSLHDFVNIGVVVALALEGTLLELRRLAEIIDPAGLLVELHGERDGRRPVRLHLGRPEQVRHLDPGEVHGPDGVILFRGIPPLGKGPGGEKTAQANGFHGDMFHRCFLLDPSANKGIIHKHEGQT